MSVAGRFSESICPVLVIGRDAPVGGRWRCCGGCTSSWPDSGNSRNWWLHREREQKPKGPLNRSRNRAPLACGKDNTFVRLCSHTHNALEPQWPQIRTLPTIEQNEQKKTQSIQFNLIVSKNIKINNENVIQINNNQIISIKINQNIYIRKVLKLFDVSTSPKPWYTWCLRAFWAFTLSAWRPQSTPGHEIVPK